MTKPTRDPRTDPKPGDRLRLNNGDEYEVAYVANGYVSDICLKGGDENQGELLNSLSQWVTFMASAEVIHAAD